MSPTIFLSTVTSEFGDHRLAIKQSLSLPHIKVQEQSDFVQGGGKLLETLDEYIKKHSDAVIHLVGAVGGSAIKRDEANWLTAIYPDFAARFESLRSELETDVPTLAYTQMEAWLALYHHKRLHVYRAQAFEPDKQPTNDPQRVHWERLRATGKHWSLFTDVRDLQIQVLRDLNDLVGGTRRKIIHMPYQSIGTLFKGRDDFLKRLRESLTQAGNRPAAVIGKALHGLGGVGKTRLAVEYAWQHADDYSALLFVTADSPQNLQRNLADLVGPMVLDLDAKDATEEEVRIAAALRWMAEHPGWLLILDSVDNEASAEEVERLLPKLQHGHVVITSRLARWHGQVQPLELDVLPTESAADFLLERTKPGGSRGRKVQPSDGADALQLAKDLGGLALALEQAGAYISSSRKTFTAYIDLWRKHDEQVQSWHDPRLMQYPRSIATTWEVTFKQLNEDAQALLNVYAWFDAEPIPLFVLDSKALKSLRLDATDTWDEAHLEVANANLADFSMVRWHGDSVTVHRVLQEILRSQQVDQGKWLSAALSLMEHALNFGDPYDVVAWPKYHELRGHVAHLVTEADRNAVVTPTSSLMGKLGCFLVEIGNYEAAEPLLRRALTIDESLYGPHSRWVGIHSCNLAQAQIDCGNLVKAESLLRRSLSIFENEDDPSIVVIALRRLSSLLISLDRREEADACLSRALDLAKRSYPPDHHIIGRCLCELALIFVDRDRLGEAANLARQSLVIFESFYGAGHPETVQVLSCLASILQATNQKPEAEEISRRVLAIYEKFWGSNHRRVARSLGTLATILVDTGRYTDAEPLLRRALKIYEDVLGPNHSDVAIGLNNLARLLLATNRVIEAEHLVRRALSIDENVYGADSRVVARDLNNLANVLFDTERWTEAEELLRRSLAIRVKCDGVNHSETATVACSLASALVATNRLLEAEELLRQSVSASEESLGRDHLGVSIPVNNLAWLLRKTNRLVEALPMAVRALSITHKFQNSTGHEHPNQQIYLASLRSLLQDMGKPESEIDQMIADLLK